MEEPSIFINLNGRFIIMFEQFVPVGDVESYLFSVQSMLLNLCDTPENLNWKMPFTLINELISRGSFILSLAHLNNRVCASRKVDVHICKWYWCVWPEVGHLRLVFFGLYMYSNMERLQKVGIYCLCFIASNSRVFLCLDWIFDLLLTLSSFELKRAFNIQHNKNWKANSWIARWHS